MRKCFGLLTMLLLPTAIFLGCGAGSTSRPATQDRTPQARFNRFGESLRTALPEAFASEFNGKVNEIDYRVEQKETSYRGIVRFRVSGELMVTKGKNADIVFVGAMLNDVTTSAEVKQGWEVALYEFKDNRWVFVRLNPERTVSTEKKLKYVETLMKTDGF